MLPEHRPTEHRPLEPRQYVIHRGECLSWLRTLPDDFADALIADPPYCSGGQSATSRKTGSTAKYSRFAGKYLDFEGENRDQRSWIAWMTVWLTETYRVLREGSPACLFTDWRQFPATTDALQAAGYTWRGVVVWDKTGAARPVLGRFTNQAEYVVWGSKGAMPAGKTPRRCNKPSNVLPGLYQHRIDPRHKHHATGKPVPLMRDIVRICEPGGLIVDPFLGSGSTGIAALELGYRFAGCELVPEHFETTSERLASVRGAVRVVVPARPYLGDVV